jgi:uncharacterized protein (TIGR03083 family)
MSVLRGLEPVDWNRPTACAVWSVKDIVAHLLDSCLRRLSFGRDRLDPTPGRPIASYADLVVYLNHLNAEWIAATRRLSPGVLMDVMDLAEPQLHAYLRSLDPHAPATFGVAWAGEETSLNWFDIAREYTERWHHQQQIRLATNRPGIMTRELYYPVLDCFMRALPFTYRDRSANADTHLRFNVSGDCGGSWYLYRQVDRWVQVEMPEGRQVSETTIPQDIAWRMFTKGIDRQTATSQVTITGDRDLGSHIMSMIAIVG